MKENKHGFEPKQEFTMGAAEEYRLRPVHQPL